MREVCCMPTRAWAVPHFPSIQSPYAEVYFLISLYFRLQEGRDPPIKNTYAVFWILNLCVPNRYTEVRISAFSFPCDVQMKCSCQVEILWITRDGISVRILCCLLSAPQIFAGNVKVSILNKISNVFIGDLITFCTRPNFGKPLVVWVQQEILRGSMKDIWSRWRSLSHLCCIYPLRFIEFI